MGTYVEIQVWWKGSGSPEDIFEDAFAAIESVNRKMSHYRSDSIVTMLNKRGKGTHSLPDEDTRHVIGEGLKLGVISGGAFDITIGSLVDLWSASKRSGQMPSNEAIRSVMRLVGYNNIHINSGEESVTIDGDGIKLDLSAIAKGFAVDAAIKVLRSHGMKSAMVNAGGDLYVMEAPPGRVSWNIGLRDPFNRNLIIAEIPASNTAIATSGNYENFFEIDGKRYCHIIDPRTGEPVQGVISVTVQAGTAMMADALATAFFIMGYPAGLELAETMQDVEAIMVLCEGEVVRPYFSEGFRWLQKHLKPIRVSGAEMMSVCND